MNPLQYLFFLWAHGRFSWVTNHSFVLKLYCPFPILGQDLLHKIGAQISFTHSETILTTGRVPTPEAHVSTATFLCKRNITSWTQENRNQHPDTLSSYQGPSYFPLIWVKDNLPGLALHVCPSPSDSGGDTTFKARWSKILPNDHGGWKGNQNWYTEISGGRNTKKNVSHYRIHFFYYIESLETMNIDQSNTYKLWIGYHYPPYGPKP